MINSLERIFDGIIEALHSAIPRIPDESTRGQAYGALDLLRNLKPRVEWAVGPLHDDVVERIALAGRIAALLEGAAAPAPPAVTLESAGTPRRTAADLEAMRDRLDHHFCEVLRWTAKRREALPAGRADEIETAIRDQQRARLRRELKQIAPTLLGEISRAQ